MGAGVLRDELHVLVERALEGMCDAVTQFLTRACAEFPGIITMCQALCPHCVVRVPLSTDCKDEGALPGTDDVMFEVRGCVVASAHSGCASRVGILLPIVRCLVIARLLIYGSR